MAAQNTLFNRIHFRLRRSSSAVKVVLTITILLFTAALISLRICYRQVQMRTEELRGRAAILEQENRQLKTDMEDFSSIEGVSKVAQQELGLVSPNAILFQTKP